MLALVRGVEAGIGAAPAAGQRGARSPTTPTLPSFGCAVAFSMPRWRTCGSVIVLSMLLIGPQGTRASFSTTTHSSLGRQAVYSPSTLLSAALKAAAEVGDGRFLNNEYARPPLLGGRCRV